MRRFVFAVASMCALGVAVGWLVHVRSIVLAERYALGEMQAQERRLLADGDALRERWERATEPKRLRARAAEVGMAPVRAGQVLR